MPTKRELYTAKLNAITKRYLAREEALVSSSLAILRQLQDELAAQLVIADNLDALRLRELMKNITRQIESLETQLITQVSKAINLAYADGAASVVEPLEAVGYAGIIFSPSQAQILTVADFSADLIRGLTSDMLTKINLQLRRAVLGGASPFEIMQGLTRLLGLKGKMMTGSDSYRAEMIVRTELARVFNLANYNTSLEAVNVVPDLTKRWLATGDRRTRDSHLSAHAATLTNPIPVKDAFIVGGASLRFPGDPAGPAKETINCRCRSQVLVPEIGVLSSPLDARVTKQIERRKEKAQ